MTGSERSDCGQVLELLDTYLDNELPSEEVTMVREHLTHCTGCREEIDARLAFRARLRNAAHRAPVPARLTGKEFVNSALAQAPAYRKPAWLAAAAAVLLTMSGVGYEVSRLRNSTASQDEYIAEISNETAPIVRVGLKDHVHCAVFRKFPSAPPTVEEMAAKMGAEYRDLIPALEGQIPAGMKVEMAHKCRYRGRQYVHLVARGGGHLISLVIAKRSEGEAFESDLKAVVKGSDGALYSAGVRDFAIAGLETPGNLVYLVSDMDQTRNLRMLDGMAWRVRRVLGSVG